VEGRAVLESRGAAEAWGVPELGRPWALDQVGRAGGRPIDRLGVRRVVRVGQSSATCVYGGRLKSERMGRGAGCTTA
jgi:hypothetical protein